MFAHRKKSNYFTRNTAKMGFSDAIYFILRGIKKSLQIELDNWFEFLGGGKTMTKQAFSQLRQKIRKVNMNILIPKMTEVLIKCFYEENRERRNELFDKAVNNITKNLVLIQPGRHFPRREPSRKNKYPLNKKRF